MNARDAVRTWLQPTAADEHDFLPDFCGAWTVFNVVVLAELLAIIVSLVGQRLSASVFADFFLVSVFVQWVALSTTAVLCATRRWLLQRPPGQALLVAYGLMLAVAVVLSEAAVWIMWAAGMIGTPRPPWHLYFHIQNVTIAAIVDALALRYLLARQRLRQSARAEARARMEVLKYRIRPHFLFNSMNIIASLTRRAPAKAEAAIEDMADLFRLMLDEHKHLVPVTSEIEVARKYLALERLRLDKRLKVKWEVADIPRTAKMPVLMLQLLLENAIHYGIEPHPGGGTLHIRVGMEGERLVVEVSNPAARPGPGEPPPGESAALVNMRQRLAGHYGEAARLTVHQEDERFAVRVVLPAFGGQE